MSFILGLSLVVVLIPFNTLMIKLTRKLPPQAGQIILYTSLIINMVVAVGWALGLKNEVTNVSSFLIGIGLAALLNTVYKIFSVLS